MERRHRILANSLLSLISVAFALAVMEVLLRWSYPFSTFGAGEELNWFRLGRQDIPDLFVPDDTLGFRPVLGNRIYDDHGIIFGDSILAKSQPARKILFIGDSVTARGRMIRALAERISSDRISYLNGGVESYNIQQEVEFFFRYQALTKPDYIIHIFHVNDLQSTPLAYRASDGRLHVYSINTRKEVFSPLLFRHSQLYRLMIAAALPRIDRVQLLTDARDHLRRLLTYAQTNKIKYDVVIFPTLSPEAKWPKHERDSRHLLLALVKELEIEAVDLLPISESMNARDSDPREMPGDNWHPNDQFAGLAAELLVAKLPSLKAFVRDAGER